MANNTGYRRKAKFAPGAVLESVQLIGYIATNGKPVRELVQYIVLDVQKVRSAYNQKTTHWNYKVYNKNKKEIQYIAPLFLEKDSKQIDLVNVGNLRVLLDDAVNGFDATPPAPPPNPTVTLPKGLTFLPIKIIPNKVKK